MLFGIALTLYTFFAVSRGAPCTVRRTSAIKNLTEKRAEIRAVLDERLCDLSRNGRVPPVVAQRAQERLVDCAACKLLRQSILREDVEAGVRLAVYPELVAQLDVVGDVVSQRLARVGDNVVVFRACNWARVFLEQAREEVVPRGEAAVLCRRVALEEAVEVARVIARRFVGRLGELLDADFAEPAVVVGAEHVCGFGRGEILGPHVEDFLLHDVYGRVEEGGVSARRAHRPIQYGMEGDHDHAD